MYYGSSFGYLSASCFLIEYGIQSIIGKPSCEVPNFFIKYRILAPNRSEFLNLLPSVNDFLPQLNETFRLEYQTYRALFEPKSIESIKWVEDKK